MALGKKRKIGRTIEEIQIGEKCKISENITDKDLLLYLGLTDDNNPLFIQHDYASLTPYKKPIVPQIMLLGMITGVVSKILPGPGSSVRSLSISFLKPVYHYATIDFIFEVKEVHLEQHFVIMSVLTTDKEKDVVIEGTVQVSPPYPPQSITSQTIDNF